jgi:hypothetical protein
MRVGIDVQHVIWGRRDQRSVRFSAEVATLAREEVTAARYFHSQTKTGQSQTGPSRTEVVGPLKHAAAEKGRGEKSEADQGTIVVDLTKRIQSTSCLF